MSKRKTKGPVDIDDIENNSDSKDHSLDYSSDEENKNNKTPTKKNRLISNSITQEDDSSSLNTNNNNDNNEVDFNFVFELTPDQQLQDRIAELINVTFDATKYKNTPPLILNSILYYEIRDNSFVDKNMLILKKKGFIRVFKLMSGSNDYCIIRTIDYISKIESFKVKETVSEQKDSILDSLIATTTSPTKTKTAPTTPTKTALTTPTKPKQLSHNEILDRFITHLIPKFTDTTIFGSKLQIIMDLTPQQLEHTITVLVQCGLLLLNGEGNYLFAIPSSGAFITDLTKGRKELLSIISKQKYKEILLNDLNKKKLRTSNMSISLLLKDLKNSNQLKSLMTTAGELITINNNQ